MKIVSLHIFFFFVLCTFTLGVGLGISPTSIELHPGETKTVWLNNPNPHIIPVFIETGCNDVEIRSNVLDVDANSLKGVVIIAASVLFLTINDLDKPIPKPLQDPGLLVESYDSKLSQTLVDEVIKKYDKEGKDLSALENFLEFNINSQSKKYAFVIESMDESIITDADLADAWDQYYEDPQLAVTYLETCFGFIFERIEIGNKLNERAKALLEGEK